MRLWKLLSHTPPAYDHTLTSHGTAFINSLAFVPPSSEYPDGLIVSGGQDTIIEVKQPAKTPQDNADALLLGHTRNVCALDVSEDGKFIISGSWDNDARLWQVGKWEASTVLQGHTAAVWAVLAYDKETIITGRGKTTQFRLCHCTAQEAVLLIGAQPAPIQSFVCSILPARPPEPSRPRTLSEPYVGYH